MTDANKAVLRMRVSPDGRLVCEKQGSGVELSLRQGVALSSDNMALLQDGFNQSSAAGLLLLAGQEFGEKLAPDLLFWRGWAQRLIQVICQLDQEQLDAFTSAVPSAKKMTASTLEQSFVATLLPDEDCLLETIASAPPMQGLEYCSVDLLKTLWCELGILIQKRAAKSVDELIRVLRALSPSWHMLGRVTFHLAENKRDQSRPFAFLATYAHRLDGDKSSLKHLPLAEALKQFAGQGNQAKLSALLTPVREAAQQSKLVKSWLESRALFQPQALTVSLAYQFLRDIPIMEESGLAVRVPNWWQPRRPVRATVQVTLGEKKPSAMGLNALLGFSAELALDGDPLTEDERATLLESSQGLVLLRGKWVEVDRERLEQALEHWQKLQQDHSDGVDFLQGMRLLAGAKFSDQEEIVSENQWTRVVSGEWLKQVLEDIRNPEGVDGCKPGEGLRADLRPYQADGVRWLWFMTRLKLGGCLADDMGLGKTIQIIDLLLRLKTSVDITKEHSQQAGPSLLIVPASLVGNWKQELIRFAPQLSVFYAHRSEVSVDSLEQVTRNPKKMLAKYDLVITTYSLVRKLKWLTELDWRLLVLDEAQAIKNASSAQTKAVKKLRAPARIALTGTPVENQLGDLWSLFDYCCPGLLGSARQFKTFVGRLDKQQNARSYGALRRLVQPYILRRLKTDPTIISDLPDKTEVQVACGLVKKQAALYQTIVNDLAEQLELMKQNREKGGMQRRGIILAATMRLKQICNHPSQYLGKTQFALADSGKFKQLAELCEQIKERQEKALIFTQFQSLCAPLAICLQEVFTSEGLVLHGGTAVKKRKDLVRRFQEDSEVPFFVISLKAGGTGLNLTAASHVIHFDRWWNPAVENQATDRAYRIGQKRNVMVHKFVCRGTLEERIDAMLKDKQDLAEKILAVGDEGGKLLTEMDDQQLLELVSLDVSKLAVGE